MIARCEFWSSKLALTILAGAMIVSIGSATWITVTVPGNQTSDTGITATVVGDHKLQVQAANPGALHATVEDPLGASILIEAEASDGECDADIGYLAISGWEAYRLIWQQSGTNGGTGKLWLADYTLYSRIPSCSPTFE
jgi:hypothetical protein